MAGSSVDHPVGSRRAAGDQLPAGAGFGTDLGAEKFLDIKCRNANIKPSAIVIVVTIKALKYNAGIVKEDILKPNIEALRNGICNLKAHIDNMKLYTKNVVVALNKYSTDTEEEITFVKDFVTKEGVTFVDISPKLAHLLVPLP